jgi:hypothetical protein
VIWLKYCQIGVKPQSINQSINQSKNKKTPLCFPVDECKSAATTPLRNNRTLMEIGKSLLATVA